jgi:hypothetical protein
MAARVNYERTEDNVYEVRTWFILNVRTEKKIKRKRKVRVDEGNVGVSIVTEHEDKIYRLYILKRRRIYDKNSIPFGYV